MKEEGTFYNVVVGFKRKDQLTQYGLSKEQADQIASFIKGLLIATKSDAIFDVMAVEA